MLALIAHAHAVRALGNEPSKMEITTCYALILFEATTETLVFVEASVYSITAVLRYFSMIIHAECVYPVQISDWLLQDLVQIVTKVK